MIKAKFLLKPFICFLLVLAVGTIGACRKDKTCTGLIIVNDGSNGLPAAGITVKLTTNVQKPGYQNIVTTGVTDGQGKVTFQFKLPAIYDIVIDAQGPYSIGGTGIIKLEPGQTVSKTVKIF